MATTKKESPKEAEAIHSPDQPALLTEVDLARMSRLSRSMLRKLRRTNAGPVHVRIGKSIRYRLSDVRAWLAALRASN